MIEMGHSKARKHLKRLLGVEAVSYDLGVQG